MTFDEQAFLPLSATTTLSTNSVATMTATMTTTTSAAQQPTANYDYRAELDQITKAIETNLKSKIETALQQLDEKFEQKLQQIEQSVDQKLQCLELMANAQAELKLTQANQAKDIEKLTKTWTTLCNRLPTLRIASSTSLTFSPPQRCRTALGNHNENLMNKPSTPTMTPT